MAARIGIHVLGPRYGESIILELPDGGVGIIDSFAPQVGLHPVIAFLESRFPRLHALRFFAVSHPHADHCFRAAEVIDRYQPEEGWVFQPFPAGLVQPYFHALQSLSTRDAIEAAIGLQVGSVALSLLQLDQRITSLRDRGLRFRYFAFPRSFTLCAGCLHLHFLTPGDHSQQDYANELLQAAQTLFADGPSLVAAARLPQPDHNLASGAVLLEFGTTRVLLMADAEAPRWQEWLDSPAQAHLCAPVHFVKAAHHGSANGYLRRFYDIIGDPKVTLAVMTPFNQGNVHLPTAPGVQALQPHVREVYCTNRASAEASTGLRWLPVAPPPLPTVPTQWSRMIRRHPALARLLVPAAGHPATVGSTPPLPPRWVLDAQSRPPLWRLIRPEHRPATPAASAAAPHSVSVYYDDSGNLLDLQVGPEAGRFHP